jgi:hypothetical protein
MVQTVTSFAVSGSGAGVPRYVAGFEVPHQSRSNWCWAAVAAGVVNKYAGEGATDQDRVARHSLGNRYPENTVLFLDHVLARERVMRGDVVEILNDGTDYFEQLIRPEIDAGRPLCAQLTFFNREHYVGISGYSTSSGGVVLQVQDPADEDPAGDARPVPLAEFRGSYDGEASWTYAFRTEAG